MRRRPAVPRSRSIAAEAAALGALRSIPVSRRTFYDAAGPTRELDDRAGNDGTNRGDRGLWLHRTPGALPRPGPAPQRRLRGTPVLHVCRHRPRTEDDRLPADARRAGLRATD